MRIDLLFRLTAGRAAGQGRVPADRRPCPLRRRRQRDAQSVPSRRRVQHHRWTGDLRQSHRRDGRFAGRDWLLGAAHGRQRRSAWHGAQPGRHRREPAQRARGRHRRRRVGQGLLGRASQWQRHGFWRCRGAGRCRRPVLARIHRRHPPRRQLGRLLARGKRRQRLRFWRCRRTRLDGRQGAEPTNRRHRVDCRRRRLLARRQRRRRFRLWQRGVLRQPGRHVAGVAHCGHHAQPGREGLLALRQGRHAVRQRGQHRDRFARGKRDGGPRRHGPPCVLWRLLAARCRRQGLRLSRRLHGALRRQPAHRRRLQRQRLRRLGRRVRDRRQRPALHLVVVPAAGHVLHLPAGSEPRPGRHLPERHAGARQLQSRRAVVLGRQAIRPRLCVKRLRGRARRRPCRARRLPGRWFARPLRRRRPAGTAALPGWICLHFQWKCHLHPDLLRRGCGGRHCRRCV